MRRYNNQKETQKAYNQATNCPDFISRTITSSKKTREQENKRTREQENKRTREQENKRTREQENTNRLKLANLDATIKISTKQKLVKKHTSIKKATSMHKMLNLLLH